MCDLDPMVSENSATSNDGSSLCPQDYSALSRDSMDMNGEVKQMDCDYLPNNNMCDDVVSSFCASSEMCASDLHTELSPTYSAANRESSVESARDSQDSQDAEDGKSPVTNISDTKTIDSLESEHSVSDTEIRSSLRLRNNTVINYNNGAIDDLDEEPEKTNHKGSKNKKKNSSPGRGRPRKALVPMYHSQISGDKNTIKIRIKKSSITEQEQVTPSKKKSGRRKRHKVKYDTDASDYETTKKKHKSSANSDDFVSSSQSPVMDEIGWGSKIPENVLFRIFQFCTSQEGALPILIRLSRVCKLWKKVSLDPYLWTKVDLNLVKERARTELRLHWLIQNRLTYCQDLCLGEWKIRNIQAALEALCEGCLDLKGLNMSGWQGMSTDNLKYITTECKKLERLDLSYINPSSAINAQLFVSLGQAMNNRLTHLVLAHNKMASFTQIVASIATHCPNLQLLDLSNIKTYAHNTALLHIEKLQIGCPKLRVLRITNSQIWLAPASITDQVQSPGFPQLEELSLAGVEDDKTTTSRSADDDAMNRILKCSTKLRLLDIRGCTRLTDSGLVRIPTWDLEHLFLSGCQITRSQNSGLELIVQKWARSLLEVDLAWSTATESLDAAVTALGQVGPESRLSILNLCGSSVNLDPVKAVLSGCTNLYSINLQSCRALPRGIKRLYTGAAVEELKQSLQDKPKNEDGDENERSPADKLSSTPPD
ncbi:hypothetical protein WA026_005676 [Henosepilachna vigintioctopunctata]|uniref:F-box domain-containing protein n=1 Tax=Henosepilachna vigintioctopunctata TaxID=420089 RepID=A0AAW1U1U1_9CUCU